MIQVIPAIIPKDFEDLTDRMATVSGMTQLVQVDIMDGRYVPEKSWPYKKQPDPDFELITKEQEGFPFWEVMNFEVDMMIRHPESVWYDWVLAGARRIIVHLESTTEINSIIREFRERMPSKDSILYTELGIAIGVETSVQKLEQYIPEIDFVQCMGIAQIGFQGQPFDERVLQQIELVRKLHSELPISVDGGVNLKTAPLLVGAGATRLVSGSAIYESGDIKGTIDSMRKLKV